MLGKFPQAVDDCSVAASLGANDSGTRAIRGLAREQLNQYDWALEDFFGALLIDRFDSRDAWLYRHCASCYAEIGNLKEALRACDQAIRMNRRTSESYALRGLIHHNFTQDQDCIDDCTRALAADPNNGFARYFRASIYYWKLGRFKECINNCTKALSCNYAPVAALSLRAAAYRVLNQTEEAVVDWRKVATISPSSPVFLCLADAYCSLGRHEDELIARDQVVRLNHSGSSYYGRAWTCAELGLYTKCLSDCNKAVSLDPNNSWNYWLRGWAYSKLGWYQNSIADCSKSIEIAAHFAVVYQTRAWSYLMVGNLPHAIVDYITALDKIPPWRDELLILFLVLASFGLATIWTPPPTLRVLL